jgi:4-nitrophenyl phosphatase
MLEVGMANRQGFIVDLDGTLYRGKLRLPYAQEFIEAVKGSHSPLLFMTNNSTRTPEQVAEHLTILGIPAEPEEVFTAAQATALYLKDLDKGQKIYCIGEQGLIEALNQAGFELTDTDADYVVQGLDKSFTYTKLETALFLIHGGAAFIQTNPDLRLPVDGGFMPGAGSIGAAIQAATGHHPTVVGKPSSIIMSYACERIGLYGKDVWMVGDNLLTDIAAGKAASCRTALILTGVSSREEGESVELDFMGYQLDEFARAIGLM